MRRGGAGARRARTQIQGGGNAVREWEDGGEKRDSGEGRTPTRSCCLVFCTVLQSMIETGIRVIES